jgi:hypothetical protein
MLKDTLVMTDRRSLVMGVVFGAILTGCGQTAVTHEGGAHD